MIMNQIMASKSLCIDYNFYKLKSNHPFFSIDIQILNCGKEIVEKLQIKKYNANIDGM